MSDIPNPPAFPSEQHECLDGSWNQTHDAGMSLRDWFAGQALTGLFAGADTDKGRPDALPRYANAAYRVADAMLEERAK